MRYRLTLSLLCTLALSACNGYFGGTDDGDGGGGGGTTNSDAQGIWVGTTSDRFNFDLLVTPNNDVWGLSWDESFNQVSRLTQGTGSQSGQTFNGTGKNYAAGASGTVDSATLTGTVQSAATFNGNVGQNVTFTSSFNTQYNNAFSLSDYAGTWNGFDSTGSAVVFTIGSDGKFTAASTITGRSGTCNINGSLVAATSGKNYSTSTLTFGSATNCLTQQAGLTLQGIGLRLTDSNPAPLLLIESTNSGQTASWFAYARKQ